jgi:hypothetical protein
LATIGIRIDTSKSELGYLHPYDVELSSVSLTCLGLITTSIFFREDHFLSLLRSDSDDFSFRVSGISYTNPLDLWGVIKSLPKEAVRAVLDRTIFHKTEKQRREIENDVRKEDVVGKKLENLEKAIALRGALLKDGVDPDDAMKIIGGILDDQKALVVPGPPKLLLPPPGPTRPPNNERSSKKAKRS